MLQHQPEIVFHLAAQSLVRASYHDPVRTTKPMSSAPSACSKPCAPRSVRAVVIVTTDKCYENQEWVWAYRETDPLGGHDPYSISKACAEFVTSAYRNSFFSPENTRSIKSRSPPRGPAMSSAAATGPPIASSSISFAPSFRRDPRIRNPNATRPWQHVLEPLRGYLTLAEHLYSMARSSPAAGTSVRITMTRNLFSGLWSTLPRAGRPCLPAPCRAGKSTAALTRMRPTCSPWIGPRPRSISAGSLCSRYRRRLT